MFILTLIFFTVALLYSMVGFGGGSSYIAFLYLADISYQHIPPLALICNIIVVSGGCFHFYQQKHFSSRLLLPFIVTSIPLAYLGGRISVSETVFMLLLASSLLAAGLRILFISEEEKIGTPHIDSRKLWLGGLSIGGILGGLSGLVGIGGGIFLAPVLHLFKWGTSKQIAATASGFILLNSFFGLAGQLQKQHDISFIAGYPWLLGSVFVGGQMGSMLSSRKISHQMVRRLTAVLIVYVSLRIFYNVLL